MPVTGKLNGAVFIDRSDGIRKDEYINKRFVASSNVEWIAWPSNGYPLMLVCFKGGAVYGYLGVKRQRAVAAAYAKSVGQYINRRIKPDFTAVKLA